MCTCKEYLHFYGVLYKSFLLIDWHTLEYYQDCHSIIIVTKNTFRRIRKELPQELLKKQITLNMIWLSETIDLLLQ